MCKLNFISITARPQPEDTLPTILDLSDYYYFDEKKKKSIIVAYSIKLGIYFSNILCMIYSLMSSTWLI